MRRIINDPDEVVGDALRGYLLAHLDLFAGTSNLRLLRRAGDKPSTRGGVVTDGGSGHEPAFLGYVGTGRLVAFASPVCAGDKLPH